MNIQPVPTPPLVRNNLIYSIDSHLPYFFYWFRFHISLSTELEAAKLEWGNSDHLGEILQKQDDGFDLILGADIYILMFYNNLFYIYLHSTVVDLSFLYKIQVSVWILINRDKFRVCAIVP